ncbi:MAG TPA: serine/threonine-protein kinase [Usitatibacteraceae bacterium]
MTTNDPTAKPVAPRQLGRYQILSELGRGAMGVVYKAEDPSLTRMVAIKTINLAMQGDARAEYEARFFREAKAAGAFNHPNVIIIYDVGRERDLAYIAMELLEGTELRDIMANERIALASVLEIGAQVADGLAAAHERGVVHRDIKPANIMIVRGDQVKIMDFGIARLLTSEEHTQTGSLLGSPKYMSPEQITGRALDERSDLFSLGVVLYEMAAGVAPFSAPDVTQLMHQIGTVVPRPPSVYNPAVPPMLDLIISKAMTKDVTERYQNATELAADLRACMSKLAPDSDEKKVGSDTLPLEESKPRVDSATVKTRRSEGSYTGKTDNPMTLSRKFDSTQTLQRLSVQAREAGTENDDADAESEWSDGSEGRSSWWKNRETLWLILAFAVAVVVAVYIARY